MNMKDLRLLNSYEVFDYTPEMIRESREKNNGKAPSAYGGQ